MRPHYLRPVICREERAWTGKDTFLGILALAAFIGGLAIVQLNDERVLRAEREREIADHLARDVYPGVRIIADEGKFVCAPPTRIRVEWAEAIGQQCKALAQLMYTARATE